MTLTTVSGAMHGDVVHIGAHLTSDAPTTYAHRGVEIEARKGEQEAE